MPPLKLPPPVAAPWEATPVEEGELGPRGQHAPGSSALMGGRWEPEPQPLPLPEPVVPGVRELLLMHPMMRQTAEAKAVVALQRRAQRLKQEKAAERVERLAIDSGSGCGVSVWPVPVRAGSWVAMLRCV